MKKFAVTYLPAIISGIALSWCFPRFHFHWLTWVALAPLLLRAMTLSPRAAAGHFYLCGHIFHSILLQWMVANIFWAGGWAILGQQLLCIVLSLFWGVLGYCWRRLHKSAPVYGGAVCLACLWTAMELLQARLFTGFGWAALGYTQGANLWTAQWAAVGGVSLLSFFIVLVNGALAQGVYEKERRLLYLTTAILIVLLSHGAGYLLLGEADYESMPLNTGVVQPNFSQEMKWDPAYDFEMLQRTAHLTRVLAAHIPVDLAVWPEALVVRHFETPLYMETLGATAQDSNLLIFTGAVRDEYATGKSFNSSALIGPDGRLLGHYDKVRLAAFGEYIPFQNYLPFIEQIAFGGISPGSEQRTLPVKDRAMGPLICFEVLFAPMAETLRALGADMLVVVTNLAWFGGSNAIPQELEIARMRAIETRLPLIHSANTGISGVFDPYGRFSAVGKTVSARGDLLDWGADIRPGHVIMRRFVDAFPVAAPATRPLPFGPVVLPWLIAGAAIPLALAALYKKRPAAATQQTREKPSRKEKTKGKKKAAS